MVAPSDVGKELGKILASPVFANSLRMTQFLKFVVEETLKGNSGRIKEYVIAIEVFHKRDDYDPQADSTVRTEASKLRSRLNRYYETEGREDPVVISIPKGSYVPVFEDVPEGSACYTSPNFFVAQSGRCGSSCGSCCGRQLDLANPASASAIRQIGSADFLSRTGGYRSLSPDGSQVAFSWKGDIHVKEVGGDGIAQVTKHPALKPGHPGAPRANRLCQAGEVFVSPLGGAERRVTESLGRAVWTPDGSALLVTLKTSPYARSIFSSPLPTGEAAADIPKRHEPRRSGWAVSPDGQTVGFSRGVQAPTIYVVPIGGGEARRLTMTTGI